MNFLERFRTGSVKVGEDLVRFESRKFVLANGSDINNMRERADQIGTSLGLEEENRQSAITQGTNAVIGDINGRVRRFNAKFVVKGS